MMNLTLPPEWQQFVDRKVDQNRYYTAEEVVLEGLRLLHAQDQLDDIRREELRKMIAVGIEQADRGEVVDGEEFFRHLRERITNATEAQP